MHIFHRGQFGLILVVSFFCHVVADRCPPCPEPPLCRCRPNVCPKCDVRRSKTARESVGELPGIEADLDTNQTTSDTTKLGPKHGLAIIEDEEESVPKSRADEPPRPETCFKCPKTTLCIKRHDCPAQPPCPKCPKSSKRQYDVDPIEPVTAEELSARRACAQGGLSCPWQDKCGSAPLNQITSIESDRRIVNGEDEKYGEWPFYVKILMGDRWSYCGGVLITDRHVLTAGHCVMHFKNGRSRNWVAIFGDHNQKVKDEFEVRHRIKSVCKSKRFKIVQKVQSLNYDYAILTLVKPVKFNDHIQPACLPYEPPGDEICYTMGAGLTSARHHRSPSVVQKLPLREVPCYAWGFEWNDRSRFCMTKKGGDGDTCRGDSGAPVVCLSSDGKWTIKGLVSYGDANCDGSGEAKFDAVYTRVSSLLKLMSEECGI